MYVTKGVDWPLVPKFHLNKSEAPFCETKRVPQEDCILHFSFFHSLHERISDEESFKVPAGEQGLWFYYEFVCALGLATIVLASVYGFVLVQWQILVLMV